MVPMRMDVGAPRGRRRGQDALPSARPRSRAVRPPVCACVALMDLKSNCDDKLNIYVNMNHRKEVGKLRGRRSSPAPGIAVGSSRIFTGERDPTFAGFAA